MDLVKGISKRILEENAKRREYYHRRKLAGWVRRKVNGAKTYGSRQWFNLVTGETQKGFAG